MKKKEFKLLGKSGDLPETPSEALIETFENKFKERDYLIQFDCKDFTSLCPVTGQPDFAFIEIKYIPDDQCVETKSLKFYLHSFRDTKAFNEQIVNTILNNLISVCAPKWMRVKGKFVARGGISLTAIAEYPSLNKDK